ncbi:MAG: 2-oxoacid:acceptor oxidoreductase family protein [Armatimonadetes bacterium]|nr:2-oxoacid:acceptor oxidoreductase family protein [Armatimonadota bacterium]
MGGEGGAVLMNWIVAAATARGLPVQSTSVPGVAQRTGATTYYIELFPVPLEELGGRRPVLSLYPGVGDIDVLVASELIEVARAMERGFVSPDRTTLIGCTHRFYSVAEKMHGTDGRYDSKRVLEAAPELARRAILFDGQSVARQAGSVVNAVLLGAVAGTGLLPVPAADFEQLREDDEHLLDRVDRSVVHGDEDIAVHHPDDCGGGSLGDLIDDQAVYRGWHGVRLSLSIAQWPRTEAEVGVIPEQQRDDRLAVLADPYHEEAAPVRLIDSAVLDELGRGFLVVDELEALD